MALIDDVLVELEAAGKFEEERISGYKQLLSCSAVLFSTETQTRLASAHLWSSERGMFLLAAIDALVVLLDHGYPERIDQIAPADSLAELTESLRTIQSAIGEFELPPTVKLAVGPEVRA